MSRTVVALLSDFGLDDVYVGALKGALLSVNPEVALVDVTHAIPAHDVAAGAFALAGVVDYFPRGTVFVAVVDPGVGSARRAVAAQTAEHRFVAPDNGLLSLALANRRARAVELTRPEFFRSAISSTFHGRDLFAPVAAHLSLGVPLLHLGPPAGPLARLRWPAPRRTLRGLRGQIIHVDRFGNLVTNLSEKQARGRIRAGAFATDRLRSTYDDVAPGELLALVGSFGLVELAAREASAAAQLGLGRGDPIDVERR